VAARILSDAAGWRRGATTVPEIRLPRPVDDDRADEAPTDHHVLPPRLHAHGLIAARRLAAPPRPHPPLLPPDPTVPGVAVPVAGMDPDALEQEAAQSDDPWAAIPTATDVDIAMIEEATPAPGSAPGPVAAVAPGSETTVRVSRAEVARILRRAEVFELVTAPAAKALSAAHPAQGEAEARAEAAAHVAVLEQALRRVREEEGKRRRHDLDVALRAERERAERERRAVDAKHRADMDRLERDLVGQIERLRGRLTDGAHTAPNAPPLRQPLPPPVPLSVAWSRAPSAAAAAVGAGSRPVEPRRAGAFPAAARLVPHSPAAPRVEEEADTVLTRESLDPPTGLVNLLPATPPADLLQDDASPWELPPDLFAPPRRADALVPRRTAGDVLRGAAEALGAALGRRGGALAAVALGGAGLLALLAVLAVAGKGDLVERAAAEVRFGSAGGDEVGAPGALSAGELAASLAAVRDTLDDVAAATGDAAGPRPDESAPAAAKSSRPARAVSKATPRKGAAHHAKVRPKPRPPAKAHAKAAPVEPRPKKTPASEVVRTKLAALDDAEASADEAEAAARASKIKKPRPGEPFALDLVF
jgi:hypothetical protein